MNSDSELPSRWSAMVRAEANAVTKSPCVQGVHLSLMRFHSHWEKVTITSLYSLCDKFMATLFWLVSKLHIQTPNFYINNLKTCHGMAYNKSSHICIKQVQISYARGESLLVVEFGCWWNIGVGNRTCQFSSRCVKIFLRRLF